MVRTIALASVVLALAACGDRYHRPITVAPHGEAVRHNMAAQIIQPIPPAEVAERMDAERAVLAMERYRTGQSAEPADVTTAGGAE